MDETDAVLASDDARLKAMTTQDFDALERLLADELVFVHTNGRREDKKTYLDSLRSGRIRYRTIVRSEGAVKMTGNVAILCSAANIEATVGNDDHAMPVRYMSVWTKDAADWRLLAIDMARTAGG